MSAASLEVVNDIIGDLEKSSGGGRGRAADTRSCMDCGEGEADSASKMSSDLRRSLLLPSSPKVTGGGGRCMVVPSKTSRSLVVDVHIPPADSEGAVGGAAAAAEQEEVSTV